MKLLVLFCIFATIACAFGASIQRAIHGGSTLKPIKEIDENDERAAEMAMGDDSAVRPPIRHPRVTCDVLSMQTLWLTLNHSACAARCLAQHRKGGRCEDGVCICRG